MPECSSAPTLAWYIFTIGLCIITAANAAFWPVVQNLITTWHQAKKDSGVSVRVLIGAVARILFLATNITIIGSFIAIYSEQIAAYIRTIS